MNTSTYTNEALGNISPIYSDSLMSIKAETDANSSFGSVWLSPLLAVPLGWRFSIGMFSLPKDGFIGILTDDEAREMKERISLFKKRFNDDFAKKHQILFGH
ncbi:hypothetical protein KKA09_03470 [Patescibacteria group bacterium]|nr:hypothetical protein [Patescibacteria group bacterium]MBU2579149.1 hypothetical protein [Patescibacteria group bacterium]